MKKTLVKYLVLIILFTLSSKGYSQFYFNAPPLGGRTLPLMQTVGIGNFPGMAFVKAKLHPCKR